MAKSVGMGTGIGWGAVTLFWHWDAYNYQHDFIYLSQLKAEECSHLNHPKFNLENTGYLLYKMGTEIFKNEEEITEKMKPKVSNPPLKNG